MIFLFVINNYAILLRKLKLSTVEGVQYMHNMINNKEMAPDSTSKFF